MCIVQMNLENKSHNLTYHSSLQPIVVDSFSEVESTFPVPFWDYVAICKWLQGMVSICLIRKGKDDVVCLMLKIFCQDN